MSRHASGVPVALDALRHRPLFQQEVAANEGAGVLPFGEPPEELFPAVIVIEVDAHPQVSVQSK